MHFIINRFRQYNQFEMNVCVYFWKLEFDSNFPPLDVSLQYHQTIYLLFY